MRLTPRSRSKSTAAPVEVAPPDETVLDTVDLYGLLPLPPKPTVPVPGCWEATQSASWDGADGLPVFVHGRSGHRLGTIAQAGSSVLVERPHLFRPLEIPVDFPAPPE